MKADRSKPIGVFDSGLGGLTVVKEIIRQLPQEDIVYYGDTARVPYGTKSKEAIIGYSIENAQVLLENKVKMIVVACNSSSSYALTTLRKRFSLPIIDVIDPGVNLAIKTTKNKRVGVIATSATVNSQSYAKKLEKHVKAFAKACPLFVPLAEEGRTRGPILKSVVEEYLEPLMKKNIDTLILGCTHYPLLKTAIQQVVGKNVKLVDSAKAVTQEVKRVLKENNLAKTSKTQANHNFLISDQPQDFERIAEKFLGMSILTG